MWNDNDGGFDNTTDAFASPTKADDKGGPNKPRCIAPVTIKQVLDSPEEGLKVNDISIQIVEICGIVKSINKTSIKISYNIEDCTGEITGASYLEADSESSTNIVEDSYCKMVGSIRSQESGKHIMVFNIEPIHDINQIFEHALAVVHMKMKAEKMADDLGKKKEYIKQEAISSSGYGGQNASHSFDMDPKIKSVYDAINRVRSDSGANIKDLQNLIPGRMPMDQIKAAVKYLIDEGHIFSTIDDDHYKSTEGSY